MDWDLPEWVEDRLEFDHNRELQQHHVAEILANGGRPYYTNRQIRAELDGEFDKGTIRNRLSEMEELGVARQESVNNGTVYWINQEESEWPIPPDVKVKGGTNETTVQEFVAQPYVQIFALGIFFATASGIVIWYGALQSAGAVSSPFSETRLLSYGLTTVLTSYLAIAAAVLVWFLQKALGTVDLDSIALFDREN